METLYEIPMLANLFLIWILVFQWIGVDDDRRQRRIDEARRKVLGEPSHDLSVYHRFWADELWKASRKTSFLKRFMNGQQAPIQAPGRVRSTPPGP